MISQFLTSRLYQEITERKHLEEKYRSIYENAIEGIFQITPEGSFISANPALARILGYDSPEDVLESLTDVSRQLYVYPEQRLELLRQVEERDVVQGFEVQFFRKDGSIAWISLNVRAVREKSGKLLHQEGSLRDVTERKLAEDALRESEERFSKILSRQPRRHQYHPPERRPICRHQ